MTGYVHQDGCFGCVLKSEELPEDDVCHDGCLGCVTDLRGSRQVPFRNSYSEIFMSAVHW